jgi:hypothetical protein
MGREKYSIWLDDERPINHIWKKHNKNIDILTPKDYVEFVQIINDKSQLPVSISFDHDLGEGKTGYDAMKFLVDYIIDNNLENLADEIVINVHSANPIGAKNIEMYWANFLKIYN